MKYPTVLSIDAEINYQFISLRACGIVILLTQYAFNTRNT